MQGNYKRGIRGTKDTHSGVDVGAIPGEVLQDLLVALLGGDVDAGLSCGTNGERRH